MQRSTFTGHPLPDFAVGAMSHERGTTLIELLLAQALGLFLLAAVVQVLGWGVDQQRQREDRSHIQEPALWISDLLSQSADQAGHIDPWDTRVSWSDLELEAPASRMPTARALFACPGDMASHPHALAQGSPQTPVVCGTPRPLRESLQWVHQGPRDCLQQHSTGPWVVNRFFLSTGALGSQLMCAGSGNVSGQALAQDVHELVFRFATREPNGDWRWWSTPDMGNDAQRWQSVVAMEVCWVMSSAASVRGGSRHSQSQRVRPSCARDAQGQWLKDLPLAAGDHRLWQRHERRLSLRHSLRSQP